MVLHCGVLHLHGIFTLFVLNSQCTCILHVVITIFIIIILGGGGVGKVYHQPSTSPLNEKLNGCYMYMYMYLTDILLVFMTVLDTDSEDSSESMACKRSRSETEETLNAAGKFT